MIPNIIPYLDLLNLWLFDLNAGPDVFRCFFGTICSIPQSEIELSMIGYLIDGDNVVVVFKLFDGWEVCVLQPPYSLVRF